MSGHNLGVLFKFLLRRVELKGSPRETGRCVAVALPLFFLSPPPCPTSQALILLASPRARRGVRVGSICLCDGRWCQAPPQGLEGEERRRLVWSGRVTDVSELSSGDSDGTEAQAEAWGGGLERGKGVSESDRDKGFRGEETGLGDSDGADTSLRFVGLQNRGLAMRNYAEWALFSPDFSSLQSQWTARGTQRRLAVSGSREETMAESVSPSPPCQGSRGENLRQKERKEEIYISGTVCPVNSTMCTRRNNGS